LNWEAHFELAFDSDTARAFHDEDLDVDTDFCAMCGHDWCSVRISKEIVEFHSGKAEGYARERVLKSPSLTDEQRAILERRGVLSAEEIHYLANKTKHALGLTAGDKAFCHSDLAEPDAAQALQKQRLVQLRVQRAGGAPTEIAADSVDRARADH
jgi:phosphomethylpyrimidine synthase